MEQTEIFEKLQGIVAQRLVVPLEKVKEETKYCEDLGADSLYLAEIGMDIEDEFNVNIPEDVEGKVHTVGMTVALIHKLIEEQS